MNKSVFYTVLFLAPFVLQAQQNLVPNGSFEEFNNCPSTVDGFYITACEDWYMPTWGTSDYFNACSTQDDGFGNFLFSVPQNYLGYQHARTGNAYAGYYAALTPEEMNYYEYLSVKLVSSLQAGKTYKLTYYLSVADSSIRFPQPLQFINHSAVWLSDFQYSANNDLRIPFTPQVVSDPSILISDSTGWQKIEGVFKAMGNEEYLTIGYFCNYTDLHYNYLPSANADSAIGVYFYVDDVSLTEYDPTQIVPNVFTPDNDGVNDTFTFDNSVLEAKRLLIVNRWGQIVYSSDSNLEWDGTTGDEECSEGIYYFRIFTETEEVNGFMTLIR